ncbi:hypothetical protein KY285_010791 [Solanum tuberosum]|nr:hypothetical protein KY285_010791 [Solanum tuberosum]
MSFLALIGETREVIIVPELGINAGWRDIAFKIEGFINTTPQCLVKQHSKPTIPYARVVERSKWQQQSHKEANASIEGPLGRSITGLFGGSERPTLTAVRKWASSTWKKAFGVDIYEMAGHIFLFEFPNKHMAEQILQGEWNWKNMKVKLEWWNPLVGCVPSQQRQEKIWIRAIGVTLHLSEEETKLRNHLRWTRIEVKNEWQKIPREVAITKQGYTFRMPIWIEKVTTFEKASGKNMENQISMAETAKTGETLDEGFARRSVACPMKRMGNTQRLKASFEVIKQVARLTAVDWMAHMGVEIIQI